MTSARRREEKLGPFAGLHRDHSQSKFSINKERVFVRILQDFELSLRSSPDVQGILTFRWECTAFPAQFTMIQKGN
jgi:hypothetical protein